MEKSVKAVRRKSKQLAMSIGSTSTIIVGCLLCNYAELYLYLSLGFTSTLDQVQRN